MTDTADITTGDITTGDITTGAPEARSTEGRPSARRESATLELRDLHRSFGVTRALDGLSLTLEPGELVALLGPSGCGKTTALRAVAGMETLDGGHILLDGRDITALPARRRDMGMVFQNYSLFPNMTARDNVAFGLRVRGARGADRTAKAVELLDMVGLADSARKYPHQLSGGQQQRVALARALAIEPAVLLLDEPLSALDAKVRVAVREHITNLHVRLGTTTLFVTHDQEEALSMADRVGVMNNGKLEQIASPNELYDRPGTAFVAQFVGTMNQLPATATSSGLHLLDAELPHAHDHPAGTAVTALARPEALTITADAGGHTVVTAKTFHGPTTRITVRLHDGHTVQVDQPSGRAAAFTVGDPVALGLAPDAQLLIAPAT